MTQFKVWLNQDKISDALEQADRILKKVAGYGPNYVGMDSPDRYFVGRCGELAVSQWAEWHGLDFSDMTNSDGKSDKEDHIFHPSGIRTNVKNSHHPRAQYLLNSVAQDKRYKYDFYIGATGEICKAIEPQHSGIMIYLWGAVSQSDWDKMKEAVQTKVPSYRMKLKDLPLSMNDFLRIVA